MAIFLRQPQSLIPVVVQRVDRVNDQIRLFRLGIPPSAQPVKVSEVPRLLLPLLLVWCQSSTEVLAQDEDIALVIMNRTELI